MTLSVADVVIDLAVAEVEVLPSGTYVWRFHFHSAVKIVLEPLAAISNAFMSAFEGVTGLDFLDLWGEDVPAGETIPPKGYELWWTDNPQITVIPYAHYDLVLAFKVSSPIAISTLVGLVLILLIAYVAYMIVSTILEKVPPEVIGIGALAILLFAVVALMPKRREET